MGEKSGTSAARAIDANHAVRHRHACPERCSTGSPKLRYTGRASEARGGSSHRKYWRSALWKGTRAKRVVRAHGRAVDKQERLGRGARAAFELYFQSSPRLVQKDRGRKEEKAEGVKNCDRRGTDCGARKQLLLTSRDIECPIELSGLERLVLPSGQRRLRAQVARVLLQQRRPTCAGVVLRHRQSIHSTCLSGLCERLSSHQLRQTKRLPNARLEDKHAPRSRYAQSRAERAEKNSSLVRVTRTRLRKASSYSCTCALQKLVNRESRTEKAG